MNKRWKNSLSHQFVRIMGGFLVVIVLVTIALGLFTHQIERTYETKINDLRSKYEAAIELEDSLNQMFFEARGYLGFRLDSPFLASYEQEKAKIEENISNLEPKLSTDEERQKIKDLENYLVRYNRLFEEALDLVSADNTEGLQRLSRDMGGSDLVYTAKDSIRELVNSIRTDIKETDEELINRLSTIQDLFIAFVVFLLLIATVLVGVMARKVGRPLHELAIASSQVSAGERVEVPHEKRFDELGELARAFNSMVMSIQSNESKLISTNEALLKQREELKVNKEELEQSVKTMNYQTKVLQHRNQLNRALASTLSKTDLLQSIISNLIEILNADRGLIVLLNQNKDYAAVGLKNEMVQRWINHIDDGPALKAITQKNYHIVSRQATEGEAGYHALERSLSYDLYLPIISEGTPVALMCLTRIGTVFTEKEVNEVDDLCRQISLSLDKLRLYETTENERKVTMEVLNTVREGIQLVDRKGDTISVNNQMCSMLDACISDENRKKDFDVWSSTFLGKVDEDYRDVVRTYINRVIKGIKPQESELVYQTNHEVPRFIRMYYEHLHNADKFIGSIFVHRDITREYEVDEMKNEFVSTVSHELRTPLSSVLGFTELMISKDLKPEKQKRYLKTIHKEASRLTVLINDFLDIQRMESGKQMYEKTAINLKPIVSDVLESYIETYKTHRFNIEDTSDHHEILGDTDKVTQLLNNLISNAVKYSPEGGEITLRFEEKNGMIHLHIEDEGLGIPDEAMSHLFEKFYRVDNSDRRQIGGTGLGLAISKEIATAHGGDLTVTSSLGQGSTFTISLPILGKEMDTPKDGGVLIVEDDDSLALLLMEELKASGFDVYHCRSGESAIHMIEKMTPRGIVLDILLDGELSGWDVLKVVKETERTKDVPIVVSTVTEDKQKGLDLGVKDYLIKPYPPQDLSRSVIKALSSEETGEILIPEGAIELGKEQGERWK
ncbi:ATP-binding protein [Alkalihalobacillus sp. CinArs1]|uniref:ATP-binding protein n=1 Tax=Alkalihalobacillus sp. CinArs1 TaxID=2995314 RepID=UPI0022DD5FE0|nr:ATP-binding protein [Alkalihalobacillus sp. CinArs1]